jgi:nicotinate phosphoribosyltransferase
MAHSYVLSFEREEEAFDAFLEDFPANTTLLVDTYDSLEGVRNAIRAARAGRAELRGVRLDSGDLLELSRAARDLLDEAGLSETMIVASGDLDEERIAALVDAGAPIDLWGVGTELGTSRDSPVVNGVYKLVADRAGAAWRGVRKLSPDKETLPGPKQVFRTYADGTMSGDVIAAADEELDGEPLLEPAMRDGEIVRGEGLEEIRARSRSHLAALPDRLRRSGPGHAPEPYRVDYAESLVPG